MTHHGRYYLPAATCGLSISVSVWQQSMLPIAASIWCGWWVSVTPTGDVDLGWHEGLKVRTCWQCCWQTGQLVLLYLFHLPLLPSLSSLTELVLFYRVCPFTEFVLFYQVCPLLLSLSSFTEFVLVYRVCPFSPSLSSFIESVFFHRAYTLSCTSSFTKHHVPVVLCLGLHFLEWEGLKGRGL